MARPPKPKRTEKDGQITVAGKLGNGSGTLFYEKDRKRWRARFVDPTTGKRFAVTAPTQEEAVRRRDAKLAELAAERPAGALGPDPTISAMCEWWLDAVAPAKARPNTLRSYGQDVRRICDLIGGMPISQLDPATAQAAIAKIRLQYGYGTTRNARARLRQVAEAAVDLGYLARNPASKVETPRRTQAERAPKRVLTPAEIGALLQELDPAKNPLDAAVGLLFTAGIRCSEALGLAWSDIDLEAGTAQIVRGCTYEPEGGCRLDEVKTPRTVGTLLLHPRAVALLRSHRARQIADRLAAGNAWTTVTYEGAELEMVFCTARGGLQREQAVGAALSRALERAGLPPSRSTHMGRRSVVTALTESGVAIDEVADYVGHADPATTRGYVQSRAARSAATAARVAELLG